MEENPNEEEERRKRFKRNEAQRGEEPEEDIGDKGKEEVVDLARDRKKMRIMQIEVERCMKIMGQK